MRWDEASSFWLLAVKAEGRSTATIKTYGEHAAVFGRWQEGAGLGAVEDVTAFHLRRFLSEYGDAHSPRSVLSVYATIRTCFRWLAAEGVIQACPTAHIRSPKVPETSKKIYSPGELRSLLKYMEKGKTPLQLRDRALVLILADTGARASELLSITLDDLRDDCLLLRQTKAKRPRMIPLGNAAQKALWLYVQRGRPKLKPKDKTLFLTPDGKTMTRNALRCMLNRIGKALGFPISAHRFRHTWATMMLRKGVDLETLRRIGGWADYEMLKTYSHLSIEDLKRAQERNSLVDGLG